MSKPELSFILPAHTPLSPEGDPPTCVGQPLQGLGCDGKVNRYLLLLYIELSPIS
jgi:hypothetical protein